MSVSVHRTIHPLVADSLAVIRDRQTPNARFRSHLERIGLLVLTDATRNLPTEATTVDTPLTVAPVERISDQPLLVPILRAGLGFLPPAQLLLPDAEVGFIGISRNEESFEPEPYVNRMPPSLGDRTVIVLDPMLATGGSLVMALDVISELKPQSPVRVVCALAAPEGIEHLHRCPLDVDLFTAAIDDGLNERAFIVPGLGDAGDRLFGRGG